MYTRKQRMCAFLICTIFIMATLFSTLFIVREADHDCTGKECPVCACIHQAEQTLKQLVTGKTEPAAWIPALMPFALAIPCVFLFIPCVTLQNWKVRLDD